MINDTTVEGVSDEEGPLDGFDRFSNGVDKQNAYEWTQELSKLIDVIEKTYFYPAATEWDLRNGLIAIAATFDTSSRQLFGPAAKLSSTGILIGMMDAIYHGNSHPLAKPALR